MTEIQYSNPDLVALYDVLNGWSSADDFYLELPRRAGARVLDAGCGTGMLAVAMATDGHKVTAIDPAPAMLEFAMQREGAGMVSWHCSTLQGFRSEDRFDLIYMTGHAFQCLLDDEDVLGAFESVAGMLAPDGRFVFETRNPSVRAWMSWQPEQSHTAGTTSAGRPYEVFDRLIGVDGARVTFETSYRIGGDVPVLSRSTLRFNTLDEIEEAAGKAGLRVQDVWGDWDLTALSDDSPEIIVSLMLD